MEMGNEERTMLREVFMAELEDIPSLAQMAREKYGIKFPEPVVDALVYLRMEEHNGRKLPVFVEYGYLLRACESCSPPWALGITTVREAIQVFQEAEAGMHELSREIGRKLLGL